MSFRNRQTDSRPFVLIIVVKSLKKDKYLFRILGINPYSIVLYIKHPFSTLFSGFNLNFRRNSLLCILQRIVQQTMEHLSNCGFISMQCGQTFGLNGCGFV